MSTSRSPSIKKSSKSHATALSDLSPFSTLACQVEATNAWRKDLKSLFARASERFADVCWTSRERDDVSMTEEDIVPPSKKVPFEDQEGVIWAHKGESLLILSISKSSNLHLSPAILYARAPNSFQARFLLLRAPAVNLGAIANGSTVSLPGLRAPSPASTLQSRASSSISKRKVVRGAAPPSSFSLLRTASKASSYGNSDSEMEEESRRGVGVNKNRSSVSLSSISQPYLRNDPQIIRKMSYDSVSAPSICTDSDALSVLSTTSTVRAPMSLDDVNPIFFQATLEYLYTAEESMKEAFEFLYEDRVAADEGPEERLDKLRQDLVFMWRSRLYSDVQIIIGDEEERPLVRTIPDNGSVTSLALTDATEEEEATFFAHRMMLVSRSPYFAAQLLSPYADADTRVIRLPSPPFTPASLHFTLGFIYTGTLFFSNRTFDLSTAFQLWRAASYLQIETLATLVSSLITHDFCHGFGCSPPCKTCIKRVPRTLAFVSSPDVNDPHLQALARNAISGPDFGSYWYKEVGLLEYTVRGALVSDVCAKIDANPGYTVLALRQLSMIGTRIDIERNSRWVDAVRWMCESVESHICAIMEARLPDVIASREWDQLIQGYGFLNDVLEKTLSIIIDGLTERRAAKVYEVIVGQILLREDQPPSRAIIDLVEEARKTIVSYLSKRWVSVRANAGFNGLQRWALKELADEIDVPSDDLLLPLPGKSTQVGPLSKTGLHARTSSSSEGPSAPQSRRASAQPGQIIDGQREPGPIHLRAAVLNRNAARTSVVQTRQASSIASPTISASRSNEGNAIMDRPRRSLGSTSSSTNSSVKQASLASRSNTRASSSLQPSITATRSPSVSSSTRSKTDTIGASSATRTPTLRTPTASLRSVDREDLEATPTKRDPPSVSAFRSRVPPMPSSEANNRIPKKTSQASIKTTSTAASKSNSNVSPKTLTVPRSRQTSTSSQLSTSSAASTRKPTTATVSNGAVRKIPSSRSVQKRKEEAISPPLPLNSSLALQDITANSNAMQVDVEEVKSNSHIGTQLALGIPCVVAPRNRQGKAIRFRATVKYIGCLAKDDSKPMVGVEVALPLPNGVEDSAYDWHDGIIEGVRYFTIGSSNAATEVSSELSHKPERQARHLRLAQMMQGRFPEEAHGSMTGIAGLEGARPSAKRRKDLSGVGLDSTSSSLRGLFIQPSEVLWVVI
jgi:hypothetical protein